MVSFMLDVMTVNAASQRALLKDVVAFHSKSLFGMGFRTLDEPICYELKQDNALPHVEKTVRDFCSAQHMQLITWPAYSPDVSPIEHVWDLVAWRLTRNLRPAASNDELFLRIQAIWNSLPQTDIQNLFESLPLRIAVLITARGGNTKY
ncbi:hypothetical protein TNCV_2747471 [Trichonephila clavipes]|nr:hypothetical protein TNCV_2747471 [Trichonephila clavipes]